MLFLLCWFLVASQTSFAFAHPSLSSDLRRRNDSSLFSKLSLQVLSPNGTDITTSFQTRVYYRTNITVPRPGVTNLNESTPTDFVDINPRGTLTYTYLGRPIGGDGVCRSRTASFQHSVCKRSLGLRSTVQDFVVFCQESEAVYAAQNPRYTPRPPTNNRGGHASTSYSPHVPPILAEDGECYPDEICIDGVFKDKGYPALASCVVEDDYIEEDNEDLLEELGGMNARVTVTNIGTRQPIKMRTLSLGARSVGGSSSRQEGSSSSTSRTACGSCSDLGVGPLAPDVESLKVEASLMTAGAMAGIFWMTIVSG